MRFWAEIGFVFPLSGKSQISIILLFIEGYVHFGLSEIGFVLHKRVEARNPNI